MVPVFCFAGVEPSVVIRVASDSIYNGASESGSEPSIAINTELQLSPQWVFGLQLQDAEPNTVRQRQRNVTAYVGFEKQIADDWLSSTYLVHRGFPGGARKWHYEEILTNINHRNGVFAGVSYANDYYSSDVKAYGINVGYSDRFNDDFYWRAKIGNLNIPSLFSYQYAELSVGANAGRFNVEVGYHYVSESVDASPVGQIASPNAVLSVSYLAF
ncbi:MAG: hypothetical protein AAGJ37_13610 [Pseudomonadota bacterium]